MHRVVRGIGVWQFPDLEVAVAATENKYRKLYEDAENPFVKFNQQQKQQQLQKLSVADRLTLGLSSFFLGRKSMRLFVLVYACLLHLLVFGVLYLRAWNTLHPHCSSKKP